MICKYNNNTNIRNDDKISCNIFVLIFPFFLLLVFCFIIKCIYSKRRIVYLRLNNINNQIDNIDNNNDDELPPSYDTINQ